MTDGGSRWPVGIVVCLGAVVLANAIMITIAVTHPSTPATADHWAESLDWDRELRLREDSAALGWSIQELRVVGQALELRVLDEQGRALSGLVGELRLERADSQAHDAQLRLIDLGEGRYRSETGVPAAGLFSLQIDLRGAAGERFITTRALELGDQPQSEPQVEVHG